MTGAIPQVLVVDSSGSIIRVVFTGQPEVQLTAAEATAGGALYEIPDHDGTVVDASTFKIEDGELAPVDPEYGGSVPAWTVQPIIVDP